MHQRRVLDSHPLHSTETQVAKNYEQHANQHTNPARCLEITLLKLRGRTTGCVCLNMYVHAVICPGSVA